MKNLEKVLKALANRRRLAIVGLLRRKRRLCVTDIAGHLKLSVRSTSKHLGVLRQADVLERVQESLVVYYCIPSSLPRAARVILPLV